MSQVRTLLWENREKVFFAWCGRKFDSGHTLTRLDQTFLNVAALCHGKEAYRFRRLIGFLQKDKQGNPYIQYQSGGVFRILDGTRRGHLVMARDIREGEQFETAGVNKVLDIGSSPSLFNEARKGDLQIIELLKRIGDVKYEETMRYPVFYLTCKAGREHVVARSTAECMQYLSNLKGYNNRLDVEENLQTLIPSIAQPIGNDRTAFLNRLFYGRGVIATDVAESGQWFGIDKNKADVQESGLQIELSNMFGTLTSEG